MSRFHEARHSRIEGDSRTCREELQAPLSEVKRPRGASYSFLSNRGMRRRGLVWVRSRREAKLSIAVHRHGVAASSGVIEISESTPYVPESLGGSTHSLKDFIVDTDNLLNHLGPGKLRCCPARQPVSHRS